MDALESESRLANGREVLFDAFRQLTHKGYLHLDNIYHSPYVIEWWAEKHGLESIAQLYREGK